MKEKISQLKEVVEFIDDDELSSQQEPFSRRKLGDFSCISQSSCLAIDSISYSLDNKSIADNLKLSVTQSDTYKTELEKSSILKQNSMITIIPYYSVIATYGTTSPKIVTKVLPGKSVKTCKRVVHKENLLKKFTLLDESVLDDDMCTDEMNKSDDKSFLPSLNSQKRVISKSRSYRLSNNSLFGSASKRMSGKMKLLNPTEVYEHSPRKEDDNIPKTPENVCFNRLHKGVELRLVQKSPKVSFTVLLGKATSLKKKSRNILGESACKALGTASDDSKTVTSEDSKADTCKALETASDDSKTVTSEDSKADTCKALEAASDDSKTVNSEDSKADTCKALETASDDSKTVTSEDSKAVTCKALETASDDSKTVNSEDSKADTCKALETASDDSKTVTSEDSKADTCKALETASDDSKTVTSEDSKAVTCKALGTASDDSKTVN